MSAWYVFSALGFYPVTPGTNEYIIGTPLFPRATINLENGNSFVVRAKGVSSENRYIQTATLNGAPLYRAALRHEEIMAGGELAFVMGPDPTGWASNARDLPRTAITTEPIVPVPYIATGERAFREGTEIALATVGKGDEIRWSRDAGKTWETYEKPTRVKDTTDILAYCVRGKRESQRISARFLHVDKDWKVTLGTKYANQYSGTGDGALVDGLRGSKEWRAGDWQGYQGVDLEITLDLGEVREITAVRTTFLQDQKSWIWMPMRMRVFVSGDGKRFAQIGSKTPKVDPKADETVIETLELKKKFRTRYLRIVANNFGVCPKWHIGAGGKAWIFADEIEIDLTPEPKPKPEEPK
jgi:hypothetical protein